MPSKDAVLPLVLLLALLLALSLHGLAASGHFPKEHRAPALASGAGAFVLFGSLIVSTLALAAAIALAWRMVPWYATVIGGGATVLAAPLLLRCLSDGFVNGRAALVVFAGSAAAIAIFGIWMVLA